MKRTLSMFGALAIAAMGFLFAAPAAQAQALQTAVNGGVTCKQYSTGYTSYPLTYWDCTNTASSPTSYESVVGQSARTMSTSMKTTLANVEIMIFANKTDFSNFTGNSSTNPPRTFDTGWYAPSAPPAQLSGKLIAAVFATADLYSPSDHQILSRNLEAYYKTHIMIELARHYNILAGGGTNITAMGRPFYSLVVNYDAFFLDNQNDGTPRSVASVWDSQIATMFPSLTPYQVLGQLYGNVASDIFAFQFASEFGSSWSHLQQFVNLWLKETGGFRNQQVFQHSPVRPLTYRNDVVCVEYNNTGYNAPADKIRDCVHPYNYTAGEHQAGAGISGLPSALRSHLNGVTNPVTLFVMKDISNYEKYFNLPVGTRGGDLGISNPFGRVDPTGTTIIPVVAFRDTLVGVGGFPGPIVENYYRGTLVHEAGHVLDDDVYLVTENGQVKPYSQSTAWANIVAADVADFNASTTNCMTALNDAEACSTTVQRYSRHGNNWYFRFLEKMGLYEDSVTHIVKTDGDRNREIFTYMFQKRSAQTTIPFVQYFEGKIWGLSTPRMKNKMDTIWSTGAP